MKHKLQLIISTSAVSVLALSALGQDTAYPKADRQDYSRQHMVRPRADHQQHQVI